MTELDGSQNNGRTAPNNNSKQNQPVLGDKRRKGSHKKSPSIEEANFHKVGKSYPKEERFPIFNPPVEENCSSPVSPSNTQMKVIFTVHRKVSDSEYELRDNITPRGESIYAKPKSDSKLPEPIKVLEPPASLSVTQPQTKDKKQRSFRYNTPQTSLTPKRAQESAMSLQRSIQSMVNLKKFINHKEQGNPSEETSRSGTDYESLSVTIKLLMDRKHFAELHKENEILASVDAQLLQARRELLALYKMLKIKEDRRLQLIQADQSIKNLLEPNELRALENRVRKDYLKRIESDVFLGTVSGPHYDESTRCYKDFVAARSISTYPTSDNKREGDPICDFYYVRLFQNGTIFSLSDGCNWGEAPKLAAQRGATIFVHYLQDRLHLLGNTRTVTRAVLKAFAAAHGAIVEGYDPKSNLSPGTATLLGGTLLPLDDLRTKTYHSRIGLEREDKDPFKTPAQLLLESVLQINQRKRNSPRRASSHSKRKRSVRKLSPRLCSRLHDLDVTHSNPEIPLAPAGVSEQPTSVNNGSSPRLNGITRARSNSELKRSEGARISFSEPTVPVTRMKSVTHATDSENSDILAAHTSPRDADLSQKWAFVFGNVGDCKAFLYRSQLSIVEDVTFSNRAGSLNAKDCGGRLGPCSADGSPDLRNLVVLNRTVETGDIIIIVSDGVHDNLDPETLGLTPAQVHPDFDQAWSSLVPELAETLKASFREKKMAEIISKCDKSPAAICNALAVYCTETTASGRTFMENNPSMELPGDYFLYPGKMDHTSSVCIKVGYSSSNASLRVVRSTLARKESMVDLRSRMLKPS